MLEKINSAYAKEERGVDSTEDWDAANDAMIAGIHTTMMITFRVSFSETARARTTATTPPGD